MTLTYITLSALSCGAMSFCASLASDQIRVLITCESVKAVESLNAGRICRKKTLVTTVLGTFFLMPIFLANPYLHDLQFAITCLLGCCLLALMVVDLELKIIPDLITQPLLWLGLLNACLVNSAVTPKAAILGAFCGYGALAIIDLMSKLVSGRQGIGGGDKKLMGVIGAFGGVQVIPVTLLMMPFLGLITYWCFPKKIVGNDGEIPFGIAIGISGMLGILYGESLMDYYFTLINL
ncbi:TPA: prepilin peptidase [Photobacterium damselae]